MNKHILFPLISIMLGLLLGGTIILGALVIDLCLAQSFHRAPIFAHHEVNTKFVQIFSLDKDFNNFWRAVANSTGEKFSTVWDFDQSVRLSKSLFIPTKMFGTDKYRYLPNISMPNCRVWTGFLWTSFIFLETPLLNNLLSRTTHHCIRAETDSNGFKKTGLRYYEEKPYVFFLGDSFTEGLFTESENTFVSFFGRELSSRGLFVNPINLGIVGYSALEMFWMLENYFSIFKPVAVFVNLFANDVHADYKSVICDKQSYETGYKDMFDYMNKIDDFSRQHNIKLFVSIIPPKEQFGGLRECTAFQNRVKEWARGKSVNILDPREQFDKCDAQRVYLSWDPHFSTLGHKCYGEFLVKNTADALFDLVSHQHESR